MPAGGFLVSPPVPPSGVEYEAKITTSVVLSTVMAATGGLMFGYDIGVSGGVTSMHAFQREFFPSVLKHDGKKESNYCKYDNPGLQLFTSSLYLAGFTATLFASYTTRRLGRRPTMLMAGAFFIMGAIFNGAARNLAMLIVEIAPTRIRGGLNVLFQLNISIGILFANVVNYGTDRIRPWGWRLSLFLAGILGALFTLGVLLVVDTPNSLVERGRLEVGKATLKKIRGTDDVEPEFNAIMEASCIAREVKNPFRNLLLRRNRPQLVVAVLLQMFQQLTGINAIMFYAPLLFKTLGFKTDAALYYAVIIGAVHVLSTLVSVCAVDRAGRRMLLLEAGVYMFLSQAAFAVIFRIKVTDDADDINRAWAIMVVAMVGIFTSSFAWSWGPLGWLIPSEMFPLEARATGQSVAVCTNLLLTFVMAQSFLSMLCHLKHSIFAFFAAWDVVMSLFVLFFLPETKNVPIEEMRDRVWKKHWFWKRFMNDNGGGNN
ncbi:unnamed protein product [Urochloa decumbens]|uniref:Major facilitator superfamily (MFS) profile domain-containing protein n=1 Tax=Urochloa decumbens TaxID=240449 RepID=A0ABC8WDE8_9POAL